MRLQLLLQRLITTQRNIASAIAILAFATLGTAHAQVELTVGVKNTGAWGNSAPFQSGPDVREQEFRFAYTPNRGAGGLLLTFSGYDADQTEELSVLVNNAFVTYAPTTADKRSRTMRIALPDSVMGGTIHTLRIRNNVGDNEPWGMRNILLRELAGDSIDVTYGQTSNAKVGFRYGSELHPERVNYNVALTADQASNDARLRVTGYDQNKYGETQVYANGVLVGYLATGPRKKDAATSIIDVDSSRLFQGTNTFSFKQRAVGNRWGISQFRVSKAPTDKPEQCLVSSSAPQTDAGNRVTNQVLILADEDIVAATYQSGPGTEYLIASGEYRITTPIVPETGDKFICEPGTVINGSILLNSASAKPSTNGTWRIPGAPNAVDGGGAMKPDRSINKFKNDVFVNDKLYLRVDSISDVNDKDVKFGNKIVYYGTFYQNGGNVFLPMDPRRRTVEYSSANYAFQTIDNAGVDDQVVIENCQVEKFASGDISAAIDASRASNWTLRNVDSRYNHTGGLLVGTRTTVYCGDYSFNGQNGISGAFTPAYNDDGETIGLINRSNNTLVKGVTASYNNWAGYNEQWHAGGMKFVATNQVRIEDSEVTRNYGVGLWLDFEVTGGNIVNNKVNDNAGRGIQVEVSRNTNVVDNEVHCNSRLGAYSLGRSWYWGANILAKNSADVTITGNDVVVDNGQPIAVVDNLFTGTFFDGGFRRARNNSVTENVISFTNRSAPAQSNPAFYTHQMMGLESDGPGSTGGNGAKNCTPPNDFLEAGLVSQSDITNCNNLAGIGGVDATRFDAGNTINNNTYRIVNANYTHWRYDGDFLDSTEIPKTSTHYNNANIEVVTAANAPTCQ